MRRVFASFGLALAVSASAAAPVTWEVADGGNGHVYDLIITATPMTFADARADAEARGGHLVTLTSAAENAFVFTALNIAATDAAWTFTLGTNVGPWIGAFQALGAGEPGGGWQWVTGETFDFTNWGPGEPNNNWPGGVNENALHFVGQQQFGRTDRWNDIPDSFPIPSYVIEYIPAPGTFGAIAAAGLLAGRRRR
jgi:hypothetical protein